MTDDKNKTGRGGGQTKKRGRGRPTLLTPETKKQLFGALDLGLSYVDCCTIAGITYHCFLNWIKKGEVEKSGKYFNFFHEVKKAIASGKAKKVQRINMDPAWQSDAWLLERQYPNEFGKQNIIINTQNDDINENLLKFVENRKKIENE
jgi:hypothetical protein